jgi:hypothetical protein
MLARRFLWVVAGLTMLLLLAALGYRIFQRQWMELYFIPSAKFEEVPMPDGPSYADASLWIARPDIADNPALWTPAGVARGGRNAASLFFIHPTSYLEGTRWNAPVDDVESQLRAELFVRHQASPFNQVAAIWAPKYRQATFGAFLTTQEDALKALDYAYRDVLAAFDAFVAQAPKDRPIILAGHSQGSRHLAQLLQDRVAGKPLARRIAAAYVIGWPISTTADLPSLGLPACERAGQAGCVLSWQSFAEPADPEMVTDVYDASRAPNGRPRAGSPMLCTNPLTGNRGGEAPAAANLGTLIPNAALTEGALTPALVPARCDAGGFLLIGETPPKLPPYVLPGNNYHVFDYALFWANVRADAEARLRSFAAR